MQPFREDQEKILIFRNNLESWNEISDNISDAIGSLEKRLYQLENMLRPIYDKTRNITTAQKNIDATLIQVENIISHSSIIDEPFLSISDRSLMANDYTPYKDWAIRVDESLHFFQHHSSFKSAEKALKKLIEISKHIHTDCDNEFESLLNQCHKFKLTSSDWPPRDDILSPAIVQRLGRVAECMELSGNYSYISMLKEHSINSMRNALKNSVLPEKKTEKKESSKKDERAPKYEKNSHKLIFLCSAFLAMLEMQKQLCANILCPFTNILADEFDDFYIDIVDVPLGVFIKTIEESIKPKFSNKILVIFDLLESIDSIIPGIRAVIPSRGSDRLSGLMVLSDQLISTIRKSIREKREEILQHPSKSLSIDGTIHTFVIETINFLRSLFEYRNIIESKLLMSQDEFKSQNAPSVMGSVVLYLLDGLKANLQAKAKNFKDQALASIFLMNNFHYILSHLNVDSSAKFLGSSFIVHYEQLIVHARKSYRESSWTPILSHIDISEDPPIAPPLTNQQRNNIKRRFAEFNYLFFDLYSTQRRYSIPDSNLRGQLRNDNIVLIGQKYSEFLNKYSNLPFSKRLDKYIKYPIASVEAMLNQLFEEME